MTTTASTLQQAARKASLASLSRRRGSRVSGLRDGIPLSACGRSRRPPRLIRPHMPDAPSRADARIAPTPPRSHMMPRLRRTKDIESDEAVWALYERWRKALNKKRDRADRAEMARRFKIFRYNAEKVHEHNTYVPDDPEEAAIHLQKRREVELLLSKGEDVNSRFEDWDLPKVLGELAHGGDPYLREYHYDTLKMIEKIEARRAVKDDVAVE